MKPHLDPIKTHSTPNHLIIKTSVMTFICVYYNPDKDAEYIVSDLASALSATDHNLPLTIAGDLNCRIDKPNDKTTDVIDFLHDSGLRILNDASKPTYISPIGSSCIDLIMTNADQDNAPDCYTILTKHTSTLRKHIPVTTTMCLPDIHKPSPVPTYRRKIDPSRLERLDLDAIRGVMGTFVPGNF